MKTLLSVVALAFGLSACAFCQSPRHELLKRATQTDAEYAKNFQFWVKFSDKNIQDVKALPYFDPAHPNVMLFILTQPCSKSQAVKKTRAAYNFFVMMRKFDFSSVAAKACTVAVYNRFNKSATKCGENGIL